MRAALLADKSEVQLAEVPRPTPGPGQVLVRVEACGICGTDLHAFRQGWTDYALGHEASCRVVEAGPDADSPESGRRVAVECFSRCGQCMHCTDGRYNLCTDIQFMGGEPPGALAEYVAVPDYAVHPVPDDFTHEATVMVEPLAVALRAVRRGGAAGGLAVGIIGAGTIGLLCTAVAAAEGAHVAVLAKHDHQVAAARSAGAAHVVQLGQAKPSEALPDGGPGLDVVIDTVAQGTSLNTAIDVCRNGGRVVLVGEVTRPMLAALSSLVHGEKTLTGSFCYAEEDGVHDFERAMTLISAGTVDVDALVSHRFPLADLEAAFATAADKSGGAVKVVVTMPE
jgi:L-iditol 2-dehydrogenase